MLADNLPSKLKLTSGLPINGLGREYTRLLIYVLRWWLTAGIVTVGAVTPAAVPVNDWKNMEIFSSSSAIFVSRLSGTRSEAMWLPESGRSHVQTYQQMHLFNFFYGSFNYCTRVLQMMIIRNGPVRLTG